MVVWLFARSGVDVDLGVASAGLVVGLAGVEDSSSESDDQSTSSSSAGADAVVMCQ